MNNKDCGCRRAGTVSFIFVLIFMTLLNGLAAASRAAPLVDELPPVTGTIRGHVRGEHGDSVGPIQVTARSHNPEGYYGSGIVDASGAYTVSALMPGTYAVEFNTGDTGAYLRAYYNDKPDEQSADLVTVTAGKPQLGIDATLKLGGTITGVVSAAENGAPLRGIFVQADPRADPYRGYHYAYTDANGQYRLEGLASDGYKLCFRQEGPAPLYLDECYDNQPDRNTAQTITLTAGAVISNVNIALQRGAIIRGRLTSARDGSPAAGVAVTGSEVAGKDYQQVRSDATGAYTVTGLVTGVYQIAFDGFDTREGFTSEYYNDKPTREAADRLAVTVGEAYTGIDAVLEATLSITGLITSETTGQPLDFVAVTAYDASGFERGHGYSNRGEYLIYGLAPGEYRLAFRPDNFFALYRPEFYADQLIYEAATPVTVVANQVLSHVNAALTPFVASRPVAIATAKGLPNALIATAGSRAMPWYSLDGGQHWAHFPSSPWGELPRAPVIGLAPRNIAAAPVRFLVGSAVDIWWQANAAAGIYRTGDNGATWSSYLPPQLALCNQSMQSFSQLVNSPADSMRLYLVRWCAEAVYVPDLPRQPVTPATVTSAVPLTTTDVVISYHYDLFSSADAGVSWQKVTHPFGQPGGGAPSALIGSPVLPGRLYAQSTSSYEPKVLWRQSDDAGQSWMTKTFTVTALALDWTDPAHLYGVTDSGYPNIFHYTGQRSSNSGDSWTPWAQQPCPTSFQQLVALPADGVLLVRCTQGLFRSQDRGDSWAQISALTGEQLSVDYGDQGRIFWVRNGALYQSRDQGATWMPVADWSELWLPVIDR